MSYKLVQSASTFSAGGTSPLTATLSSAPTPGNLIVVKVISFSTTGTFGTPTDSATTNTFHLAFAEPDNGSSDGMLSIYYAWNCKATAGADVVSVTHTVSVNQITVEEYSGVDNNSDPLNNANGAAVANATTSVTLTTTTAGCLIVGFSTSDTGQSTAGAGYNLVLGTNGQVSEWAAQAGNGAIAVTTGPLDTVSANIVAAAFRPAQSPATPIRRPPGFPPGAPFPGIARLGLGILIAPNPPAPPPTPFEDWACVPVIIAEPATIQPVQSFSEDFPGQAASATGLDESPGWFPLFPEPVALASTPQPEDFAPQAAGLEDGWATTIVMGDGTWVPFAAPAEDVASATAPFDENGLSNLIYDERPLFGLAGQEEVSSPAAPYDESGLSNIVYDERPAFSLPGQEPIASATAPFEESGLANLIYDERPNLGVPGQEETAASAAPFDENGLTPYVYDETPLASRSTQEEIASAAAPYDETGLTNLTYDERPTVGLAGQEDLASGADPFDETGLQPYVYDERPSASTPGQEAIASSAAPYDETPAPQPPSLDFVLVVPTPPPEDIGSTAVGTIVEEYASSTPFVEPPPWLPPGPVQEEIARTAAPFDESGTTTLPVEPAPWLPASVGEDFAQIPATGLDESTSPAWVPSEAPAWLGAAPPEEMAQPPLEEGAPAQQLFTEPFASPTAAPAEVVGLAFALDETPGPPPTVQDAAPWILPFSVPEDAPTFVVATITFDEPAFWPVPPPESWSQVATWLGDEWVPPAVSIPRVAVVVASNLLAVVVAAPAPLVVIPNQ